jgi:aspartate/glutamate racemase
LSKAKENGTLKVVLLSTSIAMLMQLLNSRKKMALPCVVKSNIITKNINKRIYFEIYAL